MARATRDEVERFKPYIEIAKYAISIVIALAAVAGVLIKIDLAQGAGLFKRSAFVVGIIANLLLFLASHRLVSAATAAITKNFSEEEREKLLDDINDTTYSFFVIIFIYSLFVWIVAITVISLN